MLLFIVSLALAVVVLPFTTYLLLLTACSAAPRRRHGQQPPTTRFRIVVPAHNEQSSIATTVRSLLATDYPPALRELLVVADNCSDETAARAAAAGATVLVRDDPDRRGKGYALAAAFAAGAAEGYSGAFLVVDADSVVTDNLLVAVDRRIAAGAGAVQVRYGVSNPHASWRTELMTLALAMFHDLRSLGRERLGLSCGLRGNGMALTSDVLERVPHRAHGLVEDVEHGIELGLVGVRVEYEHDAAVLGEMPTAGAAAASQRRRWEGGRDDLRRSHLPALLRQAARRRSAVALDLAVDLLTPPLSRLGLGVAIGCAIELAAWLATGSPTPVAALWAVAAGSMAAYVGRGLVLSGLGLRGAVALLRAPLFVLWKLVRASGRPTREWVRTQREADR